MQFGFQTAALLWSRADLDVYASVAARADELGFESLWTGHHLVFSSNISNTYPYSAGNVSPQDPGGHRTDPWVLFSYLAAITKRLKFATGVYVLPLVNPFSTARAVATADVLSKGRMMLGIGVGWNEDEYATVGQEFSNRGERADEIIAILRELWTTDSHIEFRGKHYSFGPVEFQPKPAQSPYPPIFYGGGTSPTVMRRAADLDGFVFPPGHSIAQLSAIVDEIKQRRVLNGRAAEPYQFTAYATKLDAELINALEGLGIDRVVFEIGLSPFEEGEVWLPPTAEALIGNLESVAAKLLAGASAP